MARMTFRENINSSVETLKAYFRQGLHELGNALYGQGTAAASPEYGMVGTKTPGEVAQGLSGRERGATKDTPARSAPGHESPAHGPTPEAPTSSLDRYTRPQQAPAAATPERDTHEPQREPITHELD